MKKSTKITLIIVAILILALVGGGLGYLISNLNQSNERIGELESQIANLNEKSKIQEMENKTIKEDEIKDDKNPNNEIAKFTYKELKGRYKANVEDTSVREDTEISLVLKENGQFQYYMDSHTAVNDEGYYLIEENNIILHTILSHGNDVGAKVTNKTINAKINEDKTITVSDIELGNRTFTKTSNSISSELSDISESIINSLKDNALWY